MPCHIVPGHPLTIFNEITPKCSFVAGTNTLKRRKKIRPIVQASFGVMSV